MVNMRYGDSSTSVKSLQSLLNSKGFNCGTPDGIFGKQTLDEVLAFQKSRGLVADGVVGTMTWNALNSNSSAPAPAVKANPPVAPSGTAFKGLDASNYQGSISWKTVKDSGIDFVYVKATEGLSFNDAEFNSYVDGANSVGIPVGAYHFAHPDVNSASAEANHFLSVIKNHKLDLIPCLDLEEPTDTKKMSGAQIEAWVTEWIDTVEKATGRQVLLYTGEWFISEYGLQSLASKHPLWIAIYQTTKPSENFVAWQYSSTGTVGGIRGNVDLDAVYSLGNLNILKGITKFEGGSTMANMTVQQGVSGGAVITLQKDLNDLGYNCGAVDGIFGIGTKAQLEAFQKDRGLQVDGVCGALTWSAIEKAIADKNAPKPVAPAPAPKPVEPVTPVEPTPAPVVQPTPVQTEPTPVAPVQADPTPVTPTPTKVSINNVDVVTHEEFDSVVATLATQDSLDSAQKSLNASLDAVQRSVEADIAKLSSDVDGKLQQYVKVTDLRQLVLGIVTDAITNAMKVNISK